MRLAGIALLCAVSALLLRGAGKGREVLLGAAGTILLLGAAFSSLSASLTTLRGWMEQSGIGTHTASVLKAAGICLTAEFGAQFCRDAGEGGIAKALEWAGRVLILALSLPLLEELLLLTEEMLG